MRRATHPAIHQVGRVVDTGDTLIVSGWGLGVCAAECACHYSPSTGQLAIHQDQVDGHLGLVSYMPGGCTCCEPWTAFELADVIRDLADIDALQHQAPPGGTATIGDTGLS